MFPVAQTQKIGTLGPVILLVALNITACQFDSQSTVTPPSSAIDGGSSSLVDAKPGTPPTDATSGGTPDAQKDMSPDAAPTPPPIGIIQSWPTQESITINGRKEAAWKNQYFRDYDIANSQYRRFPSNYTASASVRFASVYDSTNLYFFFEVRDNIINMDSGDAIYEDDSLQLDIDGNNDRAGVLAEDDYTFVFGADGTATFYFYTENLITTNYATITDSGPGYDIEFSIPWAHLRSTATSPGPGPIGINIGLHDDDDDQTRAIYADGYWYMPPASVPSCADCCAGDDPLPYCDTTRLGQLELMTSP